MHYSDIRKGCAKIAEEVRDRYGKPAMIIYIERGGMLPGRILSDELDCNEVIGVRTKKYSDIGKGGRLQIEPRSVEMLKKIKVKKGTFVLLVDDISDSGDTFVKVKEVLEGVMPGSEVVTAALLFKPKTKHIPDIKVHKADNGSWVVFEYEYNETARSFKAQKNKAALEWLEKEFH